LAPLIGLGSQCLGAHDLLLATLRVGHRRYSPCLRAHGLPLATTLVGHRRHSQCLRAHGFLLVMLLVGHRRHSQSCIALGRLDEREVCGRVVVGPRVPETPHVSLMATALIEQRSIGQSSPGACGAFQPVSQACESGLAQFSPGGLSGESGVEAASAKP
jgi:hypothetical protein